MASSDEEVFNQSALDKVQGSENITVHDLAQGLAHFFGGIPAYLHNNAAKALKQLYTVTLAYPAAVVTNAIAENNVASLERQKLTKLSGKQIAAKMQTDEKFARSASEKFARKILRESNNLNKISEIAMQDLAQKSQANQQSPSAEETPEISEDWLNVFQNEGGSLSSEEMQRLFGKILSNEIRKPSSFSIRTIKLMAQLDNSAAQLFVKLCSMTMSLGFLVEDQIIDSRVVSMGNAGANSLITFQLGFNQLNILLEYGLIISDFNSYMTYNLFPTMSGVYLIPVIYQKKNHIIVSNTQTEGANTLRMHGVTLSQAGKELLSIVDIIPNDTYTEALKVFLNGQGYTLLEVSSQEQA